MIDAGEAIAEFLTGRTRADLNSDRMLPFAMVRAIEVIGEAAVRVSVETRSLAPELPWNAIIAMRNRLIHGYFDIDADIVWVTAISEVPALLPKQRSLLQS